MPYFWRFSALKQINIGEKKNCAKNNKYEYVVLIRDKRPNSYFGKTKCDSEDGNCIHICKAYKLYTKVKFFLFFSNWCFDLCFH